MSVETIPGCTESQTAPALSALHDGALSPTEIERLRQHVETCPACRARLAEYDALADGLRAIPVPDPIGGYGRNPRLLHTTSPARPRWLFSSPSSRLRIGAIGALAAVLLIALAFAQVFARFPSRANVVRTPTRPIATSAETPLPVTPTVSSTPIALPPLTWTPRAPIPEGVNVNAYQGVFALANADGNSAYACSVTPPSTTGQSAPPFQTHVWMTHDTGSHWTRTLTINGSSDTAACGVTADDDDPNLVVAATAWAEGDSPPPPTHVTYVSRDGGASWQTLPGVQIFLQLASTSQAIYAIRQVQQGTQASSPILTDLAVSHDGMRTWTAIDRSILTQSGHQYGVVRFWLNPSSGELLLETSDNQAGNYTQSLWRSADGGQHWQQIGPVVPASGNPATAFVVQQPERGKPWHVCTVAPDASGQNQNTLVCTDDGGATWAPRTTFCPLLSAISDDGAVLCVAAQGVSPDGVSTKFTLYRLPAGASQWQALGLVPALTVLYAPTPGAGVLWAVPAQEIIVDRQHRAFTTPYPNS